MGTIHHLQTDAQSQTRLLERLVMDTIAQHPDKAVAKRWQAMAKETIARYPGPPMPSQPVLDLEGIPGLTEEQLSNIHATTAQWLLRYFDDVRDQMMQMHRDLLTLQKKIAEIDVATSEPDAD